MKSILQIFLLILIGSFAAEAEIKLPHLLCDNMVIQRRTKVCIWGWASGSEPVQVIFKHRKYNTIASAQGEWQVFLDASEAGGPFTMTFKGKNSLTIKNVLVGEVWLCSGQSNMEYHVSEGITDQAQEVGSANYPQIRLMTIDHGMSLQPEKDAGNSGWKVCNPESMLHYSATAYFFGRNLYRKYKVPIGLITAAWGGTPIEAWMSYPALKKIGPYRVEIQQQLDLASRPEVLHREQEKKYLKWISLINMRDPEMENGRLRWKDTDFQVKEWKQITAPGFWEPQGFPGFDGVAWERKEVNLPSQMAGRPLTLSLGKVDDNDFTYFNGSLVGHTEGYTLARTYTIPAGMAKAGKNIIAVRVIDNGGGGGIYGSPDSLFITDGANRVELAGTWSMKTSLELRDLPGYPGGSRRWYQLCGMYNGMIAPTEKYTIKGIIWYQGESNVRSPGNYATMFQGMISDWRMKRKKPELPFLFVQLPNIADPSEYAIHDTLWMPLREAQSRALTLPKTGMVVMTDDEGLSLHPKHKQLPAERLSLLAQKIAYHARIVASGPVLMRTQNVDTAMILHFKSCGAGLIAKGSRDLKGFELAGTDGIYHQATAALNGNVVKLTVSGLRNVKAARYNWANNPPGNLYNREGLPAAPFRISR